MGRLQLAALLLVLTVLACGGDDDGGQAVDGGDSEGDAGQSIDAEPPPITVSGVVIDRLHLPVPGIEVSIPGVGAVTTGADGQFVLEDVPVPYELVVRDPIVVLETRAAIWRYVGLRRPDPVVALSDKLAGDLEQESPVTFNVTIDGVAEFPQPEDRSTEVQVGFGDGARTTITVSESWPGTDTFELSYRDPDPTNVSFYALQRDCPPGEDVTAYLAFGAAGPVAVEPDGSYNVTITTATPDTGTLQGEITGPAESQLQSGFWLDFGAAGRDAVLTSEGTFSFLVPDSPDIKVGFIGNASGAQGDTWAMWVDAGAADVGTRTLASPPALTLPEAPLDEDATFAWDSVEGATYHLRCRCDPDDGVECADLHVVTGETTGTLPIVNEEPFALPDDTYYSCEVIAYVPFAMDDLLARDGLFELSQIPFTNAKKDLVRFVSYRKTVNSTEIIIPD